MPFILQRAKKIKFLCNRPKVEAFSLNMASTAKIQFDPNFVYLEGCGCLLPVWSQILTVTTPVMIKGGGGRVFNCFITGELMLK